MTVKQLRRVLENVLSELEEYEDDKEVKMFSNTYFLGHPMYFLGVAGWDGGYISFDQLVEEEDEDEEDY